MYYSLVPLLSHNAFISMSVGGRGIGKSFACKELFVRKFVKAKEQFVYIRRRDKELQRVKDDLFADVMKEGKAQNRHIKNIGDKYYISREKLNECELADMTYDVCGYCVALTSSDDFKSASYPNVQWILFDEFLFEEKAGKKYLKNEVNTFLGLLETVIRNRKGVRVILMANALSLVNPYTVYWELDRKYEAGESAYYKADGGKVCLEIAAATPEFLEMKMNSDLAMVTKKDKFFDSNYKNKFMLDSICFLQPLPNQKKLRYITTVKFDGQMYGIWAYIKKRELYISEKYQKTYPVVYALQVEEHDDTTTFIGFNYRNGFLKVLLDNYKQGNVYCDTRRSKHLMEEIVSHKVMKGG